MVPEYVDHSEKDKKGNPLAGETPLAIVCPCDVHISRFLALHSLVVKI